MEKRWYTTPVNCVSCQEEFLRHQYNQTKCIICLSKEDRRFSYQKMLKTCKGCAKEFVRSSPTQIYCTSQCQQDNSYLLTRYGITKLDYEHMLEEQGRVCAICLRDDSQVKTRMHMRLVVDHCHTTGKVRGLLCHRCNQGLGLFDDNPEALLQAVEYLSESQKV